MSVLGSTQEAAIRDAVVSASALDDSRVIWANQGGPRPSGQFITLLIGGPATIGLDDEEISYDADADAGEEIEVSVGGLREYILSIQAFGGAHAGDSSARALAAKVQSGLGLSSTRAALKAAGLSVFDKEPIRPLPAIVNAGFEARAQFDARLYFTESVDERTTYIETVEATGDGDLPDMTLTVEEGA